MLNMGIQLIRVDDVLQGLVQEFLTGVANDGAEFLVDAEETAGGGAVDDADGGVLERAAEPLLALPQRLLGLLLAGHVQVQALDEKEGGVRREQPTAGRPDPPDPAGPGPDAEVRPAQP